MSSGGPKPKRGGVPSVPAYYPTLEDPPFSVTAILLRVAGALVIVLSVPLAALPIPEFTGPARLTLLLLGVVSGVGLLAAGGVVAGVSASAHWSRKTAEFAYRSLLESRDGRSGY